MQTPQEDQPNSDQTNSSQVAGSAKTRQLAQKVGRLRQIQDLVMTILICCAFIGLAVWLAFSYFPANEFPWFLYIPLIFFILIPFGAVLQRIKIMRRRDPRTMEASVDQPFAGIDNVHTKTGQMNEWTAPIGKINTSSPYAKARIDGSAEIVAWFGPADRTDQKGLSRDKGLVEYISPENTLIFTRDQMIALTLTQEDFDALGGNGAMDHLAAFASVRREAEDQKMSVATFNSHKWPKAVDWIRQTGLETVLASHYNYGISLNDITQIEAKKRFVNPGIYVHLKDGTTLKFTTFGKEAVDNFLRDSHSLGLNIST
jgi:hypothetical protein